MARLAGLLLKRLGMKACNMDEETGAMMRKLILQELYNKAKDETNKGMNGRR